MAITREQAEAALAAVRERYAGYDDAHEITLIPNWDGGRVAWMICWEDGPYEWAYRAAMGGLNEEVATELTEFTTDNATLTRIATEPAIRFPPGVTVEPYHTYSLGLYGHASA